MSSRGIFCGREQAARAQSFGDVVCGKATQHSQICSSCENHSWVYSMGIHRNLSGGLLGTVGDYSTMYTVLASLGVQLKSWASAEA